MGLGFFFGFVKIKRQILFPKYFKLYNFETFEIVSITQNKIINLIFGTPILLIVTQVLYEKYAKRTVGIQVIIHK